MPAKPKFKKYIKRLWLLIVGMVILFALTLTVVSLGLFGELPTFEELENPQSALATEIFTSDGKLLGKYYSENRSRTTYDNISPSMINALIATEDIRYNSHSGIDLRGLFRVGVRTLLLGQRQSGGGSTITQQLAKNLFPRTKNQGNLTLVITKMKEWITAVKLERNYTKEEIIEMYLNTVFFGSNSYGLKSAAKTFFDVGPDSLNIQQSALLTGVLKAQTTYNPFRDSTRAFKRREVVLNQMRKSDYLTQAEYDSIRTLPLGLSYTAESHQEGLGTYFREHLRSKLHQWCKTHQKTDGSSNYNLYKDGLKIYTTIDSRMQLYAEQAVADHLGKELQNDFYRQWKGRYNAPFWKVTEKEVIKLMEQAKKRSERYRLMRKAGSSKEEINQAFETPVKMKVFHWEGDIDTVMTPMDSIRYYKWFLQSGLMSMEPQTGHIKAWVGGINYKHFKYDHVLGKRQVGSTFKPFVYALAIRDIGYSPCDKLLNVPTTFIMDDGKEWTPKNSNKKFIGEYISLKRALANSENWITANLMKKLGPQPVIDFARDLGITSPIDPYPAICLGTPDLSLYEVVGANAAFANKGQWIEPIIISRIEDKSGNVLEEFRPEKKEAMSEEHAYIMLNLMKGVVQFGTGVRLRYKYQFSNEIAGKTGTTQNNSDGWFIGITPELVTGIWTGCEDRSVHFLTTDKGQGANTALPIWGLYMQQVYADESLNVSQEDFDKPENDLSIEIDCDKYNVNPNFRNRWDQ